MERSQTIPAPQNLDYETYCRLRDESFSESFQKEIARIFSKMMERYTPKGIDEITDILKSWDEVRKEYRSHIYHLKRKHEIIEEITMPTVVISSIISFWAQVPLPLNFIILALNKSDDLVRTKGPFASPGRMIAQLVWKAKKNVWSDLEVR